MLYKNVKEALLRELARLTVYGHEVTVRGSTTMELLHESFSIEEPADRLMCVKHRNGNPFAQIAETLWVLAGRNDLDWLERYIPQCKKWSDDGKTWRAAYGPRLRYWGHRWHHYKVDGTTSKVELETVDQLAEVVNKLRQEPYTRQAIISIWDPAQDWVEGSRDYPCNNWLHFLQRDGQVHLNVAVRSNDAIFGFSHVDFFCWSVLQQIVAHLTGFEVGQMTWNASSFHIYERHYDKAQQIVYDNSIAMVNVVAHPPVETVGNDCKTVTDLDDLLSVIFDHEVQYRNGDYRTEKYLLRNDIFDTYAYMLFIYNYWLNNKQEYDSDDTKPEQRVHIVKELVYYTEQLPWCASKVAAIEYFSRLIPGFTGQLSVSTEEFRLLQALHII